MHSPDSSASAPTASRIATCFWHDADAEAAAALYTSLFPRSRVRGVSRYPDGRALVAELEVDGQRVQLLNGGPIFKMNPSISTFVQLDSADEVDRVYAGLVDGGMALMPLGAYPWSPRYAWVQDRFGASWQLIVGRHEPGDPLLVPCLMFANANHGRAAEAIALYTRVFADGRTLRIEHYAPGEGPVETIKHGRFVIGGRELVAMDAHGGHGFTFGEGISLAVSCRDQAEVDHLWDALIADGGAPSRCGWLKDRFGVSWQIVPAMLGELQARGDGAATGRMFQALMGMDKLDIAGLERAYRGE